MKTVLMAAGAALMVAGCESMDDDMATGPMPAAAPMAAQQAMMSESARQFAMMSASSNMFEIQSSQLALQASQNPMVRQFAQQMITEHSALLNQMAPVAAQMGLDPNAMALAPHHARMLDQLRSAGSGPAFDAAYHQAQSMAHQEALNLHRSYATSGDNPQLRSLAAAAVPVIENHWNMLQMHRDHWMQPQVAPRAGERG